MSDLETLTYTVQQAAQVLQCGDDNVYRAVKNGTIPTVPGLGKRTLISRQWLTNWVATVGTESGRPNTAAPPTDGGAGTARGFHPGARPEPFGRSETGTAHGETAAVPGRDGGGEGPADGARPNHSQEVA